MKKRFLVIITFVTAMIMLGLCLTGCGDEVHKEESIAPTLAGLDVGESVITYPSGRTAEIDDSFIALFVNGSIIETESVYLSNGEPMLPYVLVTKALGLKREDVPDGGEEKDGVVYVSCSRLEQDYGVGFAYVEKGAEVGNMLYTCPQVMLWSYHDGAKTREEAAAHLKSELTAAWELRFGEDFTEAESEPEAWDDKESMRLKITTVEDALVSETDRYYIYSFVWDFLVDKYSGVIFVRYNGISTVFTWFDSTSPSALTFAG